MPKRESDPVSEAMAATDHELFASAMGGDDPVHDDTGDRSLEAQDDSLEGKVEDEGIEEVETEAAEEGETEVEAKDDKAPAKDPKTGKFVKAEAEGEVEPEPKGKIPPAVLREANQKRKAVETERDTLAAKLADSDKRFSELNGKFDLVLQQLEASRRPQPEVKKTEPLVKPDKFADPDGYDKWVEDRIAAAVGDVKREYQESQEAYTKRVINMNFAATHEAHGDKFEKAYQAILEDAPRNPETRLAIQRIWNSDNPGSELMKWHRNRETLQIVGSDPEAYRQKIADETRTALLADPEFRKEMIAAIKGDVGKGSNVRSIVRLPKSLNGASGSSHLADTASLGGMTDDDLFEDAVNNRGA